MKLSRGWRVALVIALTVLLAVPLYQLATRASADYYTQQAKNLYDNVSHYFSHIDNIYNNTLYHDGTQDEVKPQFNFSSSCDGFPDTTGILLLMKTGGTESFDKLPVHLLTTMSCLPDFLIFSDLVCGPSQPTSQPKIPVRPRFAPLPGHAASPPSSAAASPTLGCLVSYRAGPPSLTVACRSSR